MKKIWCLFAFYLILVGCNVSKENNVLSQKNPAVGHEQSTILLQKQRLPADKVVDLYVRGFNESNPNLLIQTMHQGIRQYYPTERAKAALEDHKVFFENELLKYDFVSTQVDNIENSYGYRIYSKDKERKVVVVISEEGAYVNDLLLNYSYFVHLKMECYIIALKNKDRDKVAGALSEGDLHFPLAQTDKVIKQYESKFDLFTINYRLIDVNKDSFIYLITGTKNGEPVEHQLRIVCGDMMTGIRDSWIPLDHWEG
ncbi:MAG: hypothetical protein AB1341_14630 [Bacillota bacterium]